MDRQYLNLLIEKYLSGQCSDEEKEILDQWYATFSEEPGLTSQLSRQQKDALQEKMLSQIRFGTGMPKARPDSSIGYRVAAAVLVLLTVGSLLFWFLQYNASQHYRTAFRETQTITLPDQSVITLNANSTLQFDKDWETREVWLEGEAFFEVAHNPAKPFTVHANQLDVQVLGTTFNVNDRHGKTQVVLNSGKVKLKAVDDQQELVMAPGELAEFSDNSTNILKKQVEVETYISWKQQLLIFKETSLQDIVRVLEDNYGFTVTVQDPAVLQKKLTGKFSTQKADVLLKAIQEIHQLKITRQDQHLTISQE